MVPAFGVRAICTSCDEEFSRPLKVPCPKCSTMSELEIYATVRRKSKMPERKFKVPDQLSLSKCLKFKTHNITLGPVFHERQEHLNMLRPARTNHAPIVSNLFVESSRSQAGSSHVASLADDIPLTIFHAHIPPSLIKFRVPFLLPTLYTQSSTSIPYSWLLLLAVP